MIGTAFAFGFLFIFVNYHALSFALQYYFYGLKAHHRTAWKIQSQRSGKTGEVAFRCWVPVWHVLSDIVKRLNSHVQGIPIRSVRRTQEELEETSTDSLGRAPNHALISAVNCVMASSVAGIVCELVCSNRSLMTFTLESAGGLIPATIVTIGAFAWQLVLEYYWHRLMHLPFFYRHLHKLHHRYKSPEPFDDLYIHPLEAFGYYCILYSPPFVMPLHVWGFAVYMAVMGLCGVLDHSGVKGLYCTDDHDKHHQHFNVNYAFPFVFMDVLHGTYVGAWCGKMYPLPSRQHASGAKGGHAAAKEE